MRKKAQVAPQYTQPNEVVQQEDALSRVPIYPRGPEDSYNKLERDYFAYTYTSQTGDETTLGFGDKMRIMDNQGNLRDIMLMPDGSIGIQDLELKLEYGKTETYPTWEDAANSLPSMEYEPIGHTASLKVAARKLKKISKIIALSMYKLFRSAIEKDRGNENPYVSRRWKRSKKHGNG